MESNNIPAADDPGFCPNCSGSGEGPADGTTCRVCHGSGVAKPDDDNDEEDCDDQDD